MAFYYSSENFYSGSDDSFSPDFNRYSNFTGFTGLKGSQIGFSGNPMTGNQLGEAINAIKQGTKVYEVSMLALQGEPDQNVPKQHFDEMRALFKLTGVKPSVHGSSPGVDPAGFTGRGWGGEETRAQNERRIFDSVQKAHLVQPDAPIPVVLHTGNSGEYSTNLVPELDENGKIKKDENGKIITKKVLVPVINRENNQVRAVEPKYKIDPRSPESLEENKGKGKLFDIDNQIKAINRTEWENSLLELANYSKQAEEIIGSAPLFLGEYYERGVVAPDGTIRDAKTGAKLSDMTPEQKAQYEKMKGSEIFIDNLELGFNSLFERAYKYGSPKLKEKLKKFSEEYSKGYAPFMEYAKTEDGKIIKLPERVWNPHLKRQFLDNALKKLNEITEEEVPQINVNASDFAMEKAAETFSNLAYRSYKELGKEKSPFLAIENIYEGLGFSTAEDHKRLIEKARENLVKKLVEKDKISEKKARKIAEEKIGATWDIGHINMAKRSGFDDEYAIQQTKEIAPYVKHVHVTDNFGFHDTHLSPGMGNVPIKEMLEQLEKHGKIDEMMMIVEAGGMINTFKRPAHPWSLSAFNTGVYGAGAGPGWNDANFDFIQANYFGGYGATNPEIHHSLYGAGFTTLPTSLGGQIPGTTSRFSGTPLA